MTTPELPEFAYNVQTRAARIGSQIAPPSTASARLPTATGGTSSP